MSVNYLKPAKTDLVVVAQCALPDDLGESSTLDVTVEANDNDGITVFRAVITMHVSKRR
jgi:acyl-coenzyme A thioesterase PaaI-like protein